VSSPQTVKIPQHNRPDGSWCPFSGCDSISGICRMCEPSPALSDRETAALLALDGREGPVGGGALAAAMRAAGRNTSAAAAHQGAASLARNGLAVKDLPDPAGGGHVRYEITSAGREWVARYRAVGGPARVADGERTAGRGLTR
jgi:hypothetical protein